MPVTQRLLKLLPMIAARRSQRLKTQQESQQQTQQTKTETAAIQDQTAAREESIQAKIADGVITHNLQQSRITNDMAWTASDILAAEAEEQLKNRQAENIAVRRTLWGVDTADAQSSNGVEEDTRMKRVLGDNHETVYNYPAPAQPRRSNGLLKAGLLALAVAVPATAGVIMLPAILDSMRPSSNTETTTTEIAPTAVDTDTDTNTQYELDGGFWKP